jgi:hypothetical protein
LPTYLSASSIGWTLIVVDIVVKGQHPLGLILLSTSSSPNCQRDFAWLSFSDLVAGGQHKLGFLRQPHRRRPASAGLIFIVVAIDPLLSSSRSLISCRRRIRHRPTASVNSLGFACHRDTQKYGMLA